METTPMKVVSLVRVSTEKQEWDRQRRKKIKVLRTFGLDEVQEIALKVSGTVVERTQEYRQAVALLSRPDVAGLVVPSIDRWFRYKLISEIGRYVEPFEQMLDGQTSKRIFCTINEKCESLDLRNRDDQDKLLDAVRYASKEREVINGRFADGKENGRENTRTKVDKLPLGVTFTHDWKPAPRETHVPGTFAYNDFAYDSVKPLFERFLAGETIYSLSRELGFKTVQSARHTLRNLWYVGIKHRTRHVVKKWSDKDNKFVYDTAENQKTGFKHSNPITVETNLAAAPLVTRETFDAVQERLAERAQTYGKRKKITDDFLASPLLHCSTCGGSVYGRRYNANPKKDNYTCANRQRRNRTCTEPIYSRSEIDHELASQAVRYLTDDAFVSAKIRESMNEDHKTQARATAAAKLRTVENIEKRCTRVRKAIEETDDHKSTVRLKELLAELARAKADYRTAQAAVTSIPTVDVETLAAQVKADMSQFPTMERAEQKALLSRYVTSIMVVKHLRAFQIVFDVRIGNPMITTRFDDPALSHLPASSQVYSSSNLETLSTVRFKFATTPEPVDSKLYGKVA